MELLKLADCNRNCRNRSKILPLSKDEQNYIDWLSRTANLGRREFNYTSLDNSIFIKQDKTEGNLFLG